MMADHINITHPDRYREWRRNDIETAKLKAEIEVLERSVTALSSDLDAIFTRIASGDEVELHYPDGSVIVVKAEAPQS